MALTFDRIKDLIGINGTVGVDLLGSARVRDNLFVSGYLTVGGKRFTGLNINGVKAIDKDVKWKGEYIEIEKGGTGQDLSDATGAVQISDGSLNAGTLDIDKGGTGEIVETNWKNSYITTKADGTLNYDGTEAITPDLTSIDGTLTVAKGGTGEIASDIWLNSRITTNANGTLNYDATSATAPSLPSIGGTLTVAKGGTSVTSSNTWLNSRVQINTDGTLNYAAGGSGTPTLTTLGGTLTPAKGGTGQDLSSSTGLIIVSSGTVAADATPAVNLTDATNVPLDQVKSGTTLAKSAVSTSSTWATGDIPNLAASKITSGTLAIAQGGTNASNSNAWLNSRVTTNANGTLNYDATGAVAPSLASIAGTVAKAQGGFGADASSVSVALITDNIEAGGLKTGRAIGDGIESQIIWADENVAGTSTGNAAAVGTIWEEAGTSIVDKVAFNYFHQTETLTLITHVLGRTNNGAKKATIQVQVSDITSGGGTLGASAGTARVTTIGETTSTTFTEVKMESNVSGLTNGSVYRIVIGMKVVSGAVAYMTGIVVLTQGA